MAGPGCCDPGGSGRGGSRLRVPTIPGRRAGEPVAGRRVPAAAQTFLFLSAWVLTLCSSRRGRTGKPGIFLLCLKKKIIIITFSLESKMHPAKSAPAGLPGTWISVLVPAVAAPPGSACFWKTGFSQCQKFFRSQENKCLCPLAPERIGASQAAGVRAGSKAFFEKCLLPAKGRAAWKVRPGRWQWLLPAAQPVAVCLFPPWKLSLHRSRCLLVPSFVQGNSFEAGRGSE